MQFEGQKGEHKVNDTALRGLLHFSGKQRKQEMPSRWKEEEGTMYRAPTVE
jgi:hypothetical protein